MLNPREQMKKEWDRFRQGFLRNFIRSNEQQRPNQAQVPPKPNTTESPKKDPPSEPKNDPSKTPVQDPPLNL
ncbi:MAG TPA: hypothetical protein PL182_08600 [Pseudobdellovibrionaceae bacterium]|nr:hypothetical protein [Pseudobdellovibrionaceae bacterium]